MNKYRKLLWLSLTLIPLNAAAQTVSGSGSSGTVPVFTGSSTIGSSPITATSSGNVGIGTTNPQAPLDVESGGIKSTGAMYVNGSSVNSGNTSLILNNGYTGGETYALSAGVPNVDEAGFSINRLTGYSYGTWIQTISSPVFTIHSGNIGIGTAAPNPTFDLTVNGNGIFTSNSTNNSGVYITGQVGPWGTIQGVNAANTSAANLAMQQYGGNVGIGTTAPAYKLDVAGQLHTSGSIVFADNTTQSTAWTGSLCGGDYAESIDVSDDRKKYEPGDVLVIDPDNPGKFLKSADPYSTMVMGIYSTKPGVVGRRQTTEKNPDEIPMAMIGIVPVKVSAENGPIRPGDLLVTSSLVGYAMKGTDHGRMLGAVLGKALGSLAEGKGVIEVGVALQ